MSLNRFQLENLNPPAELLNAVIQQLTSHASVRTYRPDPLPEGVLEVLITVAQSASTSSNLQNYSIIAVEDAEKRRQLAEITKNAHVAEAPLFLVFCPDLYRMERVCQRQGHPFADRGMDMFLQAVVDAALVAQNAAVAAESLGLGICMIGGIRNDPVKVAELLKLPPRTFALVGMTVGYPAEPPKLRHRLPLDVILHREAYSDAGARGRRPPLRRSDGPERHLRRAPGKAGGGRTAQRRPALRLVRAFGPAHGPAQRRPRPVSKSSWRRWAGSSSAGKAAPLPGSPGSSAGATRPRRFQRRARWRPTAPGRGAGPC